MIIPTYNQAGYLREAVDSVLAQTYLDRECIVVDDGSTDETPDILASYGDRIVTLHQTNRGAANALNAGIRAAKGELICWLSSDDAYLPSKLERQVQAFIADPEAGMCCTGWEVMDEHGLVVERYPEPAWLHPDPFVSVFWHNLINGTTVMIRRRVFDECGLFNEDLRADVDGEMWLRIALRYRIILVPGVLARYRTHAAAQSRDLALMRSSKTRVRLPLLQDGTLVARIRAQDGRRTGAVLALIGWDHLHQGLPLLGRRLFFASARNGLAIHEQARLARAIVVPPLRSRARSTARKIHRAVRSVTKALARVPGMRRVARGIRNRR